MASDAGGSSNGGGDTGSGGDGVFAPSQLWCSLPGSGGGGCDGDAPFQGSGGGGGVGDAPFQGRGGGGGTGDAPFQGSGDGGVAGDNYDTIGLALFHMLGGGPSDTEDQHRFTWPPPGQHDGQSLEHDLEEPPM